VKDEMATFCSLGNTLVILWFCLSCGQFWKSQTRGTKNDECVKENLHRDSFEVEYLTSHKST
jgi:hypothetical protein